MAKGPDQNFCVLGAQSIIRRLAAFTRPIEGVRQGRDTEFVHKMRVASRRLRNAIAMFHDCLPGKKGQVWYRRIRKVTAALGEARDTDVQIQSVAEYLEKDCRPQTARAGMDRLLLQLKRRRQKLQKKVLKALDRLKESNVIAEIGQFCKKGKARAKKKAIKSDSPALRRSARGLIAARLAKMLGFQQYVDQPQRVDELHQMRIAARRLRYTLEIFSGLYGKKSRAFVDSARQIQAELGRIHDCDVWIAFLPVFLQQERTRIKGYLGDVKPFRQFTVGINLFREHKRQLRNKLFGDFVGHWKDLARRDTWGQLLEMIKTDPEAGK